MKPLLPLSVAIGALLMSGCGRGPSDSAGVTTGDVAAPSNSAPPIATTKPYEVVGPNGLKRQDEYYWLRDDTRKNPEMLAYLNAENAYADSLMAPLTTALCRISNATTGITRVTNPAKTIRSTHVARARCRLPKKSCSMAMRWRRQGVFPDWRLGGQSGQ